MDLGMAVHPLGCRDLADKLPQAPTASKNESYLATQNNAVYVEADCVQGDR